MLRNQVHPRLNPQNITSSASSQQSAAVAASSKFVRIATVTATYVEIGANPTATSASLMVPANSVEIFSITGGHKVAVLQVSTSGVVSITEGAQN